MVKKKLMQVLGKCYLAFIFIFLYAPIITLIVLSFNESRFRGKWGGFSLKWYTGLFQSDAIMDSVANTLVLALISALIATVFGTVVCFAMNHMKKWSKTAIMSLTNIPMLNADIVTGISLMLLYIAIDFTTGFSSVLLAHITFNLPYVILSVAPRVRQVNRSTYEAALDLGASKPYAFWKVILPDVMPGVLTGFLLSFTMSLDDFVITHFTKGKGMNTLSTQIYAEQKKGIRPEMYALSTLMFVTVFVLLLIYNRKKDSNKEWNMKERKHARLLKGAVILVVTIVLCVAGVGFWQKNIVGEKEQVVNVYNWGEYMDPEVIKQFEKETGIRVVYDEFETNEAMYPKVAKGEAGYDLICPSDYMIQRMQEEDLLEEINWDNIPNKKYIDKEYWDFAKSYDGENKYTVPYFWGTVGILYNKNMVKEEVDSWSILWDEKYKDNVLMQKSVRDAFGITLKYLGYSLNTTNREEIQKAKDLLIQQKESGIVQAYVVDEVRDKMIGEEAAMGVIYSGEALTCQEENPNLEYVIPKEGSNLWMDSWVIPVGAENKENAEKFLNFICQPEMMKKNFDYVTYSIPSEEGRKLVDEEYQESSIAFPEMSSLTNCEVFKYLGVEADQMYNEEWKDIMGE